MRANIALIAIGLQVGEIHQHQTIHAVIEIRIAAEIDKTARRPARTLPSTAYTAAGSRSRDCRAGTSAGPGRRCNPPRQTAPARRAATPDKVDATPPADASPGTTAGRTPPADRGRRAATRQKSTPDQTDSDSADSAPDKRRCRTTGSPARDAPVARLDKAAPQLNAVLQDIVHPPVVMEQAVTVDPFQAALCQLDGRRHKAVAPTISDRLHPTGSDADSRRHTRRYPAVCRCLPRPRGRRFPRRRPSSRSAGASSWPLRCQR